MLVIITMSMMSLFALGTSENSRNLIQTASVQRDVLRARLAAESAVGYVNRQLTADKDWAGSGDWVNVCQQRFLVTRIPGPPGPNSGFIIEAEAGDSQMALKADFVTGEVDSPVIDHAVAFLGGNTDFNNVEIHGDLLAVDTEGGVKDYDPFTGEWETRSSGGDPVMDSVNNLVTGSLATTSGSSIAGLNVGGSESGAGAVVNPAWDLDSYLIPNPDTIIVRNVSEIRGMVTNKTVVVVNDPGTSVEFKKCKIGGGVVMWAPSDWPQRGPSRNGVTWTQSTFGTAGGGTGTYQHIGMLAPASRLDSANAANPGNGLFYFHEMGHMNNATINGALWVVNDTGQWNNVDIFYEPGLSSHDFMGMEARYSYVNLVGVSEFYPVAVGTIGQIAP